MLVLNDPFEETTLLDRRAFYKCVCVCLWAYLGSSLCMILHAFCLIDMIVLRPCCE